MPRYFDPIFKLLFRSSDEEAREQVRFLKAENRILRSKLPKVVRLTESERRQLVELGRCLRWTALKELISVVHPATFARWVRRYRSTDPPGYERRGSKVGRPPVCDEVRELVLRVARESGLGYTRIQGEMTKLGVSISRTTIVNILRNARATPDPTRGQGSWSEFLAMHAKTLWACDFFSVNAITPRGIKPYYMMLFIHIASRRIIVTPSTMHPTRAWVAQQARNFAMQIEAGEAALMLRDRDQKFVDCWDAILRADGIRSVVLPRCSPRMNAFAERAIKTVKHECLYQFVICGRRHLDYLVGEFTSFYNHCRPHSARDRLPPIREGPRLAEGKVRCDSRLGGLLKHYYRRAA